MPATCHLFRTGNHQQSDIFPACWTFSCRKRLKSQLKNSSTGPPGSVRIATLRHSQRLRLLGCEVRT